MAIFNSYVKLPEGTMYTYMCVCWIRHDSTSKGEWGGQFFFTHRYIVSSKRKDLMWLNKSSNSGGTLFVTQTYMLILLWKNMSTCVNNTVGGHKCDQMPIRRYLYHFVSIFGMMISRQWWDDHESCAFGWKANDDQIYPILLCRLLMIESESKSCFQFVDGGDICVWAV